MRLKLNLPNHPNPRHAIATTAGDFTLVYSQQPNLRGPVLFAIRAVSGLRIDLTAYHAMPDLEARMASGIEFFCPGRRPEVDAIAAALIRDGLATEVTGQEASRR